LNPATTLPALIICVGLIGPTLLLALRLPRYGFPLAAYVVFQTLEAGPVNLEMIFEHRMYLPGTFLAPLVTVFLIDAGGRYRSAAIVLFAVLGVLFASWTNARNQTWAEPLGIHRDMAMKSPNKARAQYAYALGLLEAERAHEALPILKRAVDLHPTEGRVQRLLGKTLLELGKPAEAEEAYRAAVSLFPEDIRSKLGLGRAMAANGNSEAAARYYISEGIRLGRGGRPFEAIPILSAAVELQDDNAGARNALGGALMGAGLKDKALEQFRAAVRLDSTMFEAWFNLGHAAERLDQPQEAIGAYQAFIEHAPDSLQQPIMRARERIRALSSTDE
jgi:tetratricopeptide (TPR) repeat protein